MKVWSELYDSYVSESYHEARSPTQKIAFNINKCIIKISEFGFIDLYLDGKKIKRLTTEEYIKYRFIVLDIENNANHKFI